MLSTLHYGKQYPTQCAPVVYTIYMYKYRRSLCLTREERRGEDNVPDPALALDLCVEAAGTVT